MLHLCCNFRDHFPGVYGLWFRLLCESACPRLTSVLFTHSFFPVRVLVGIHNMGILTVL